MPAPVSALCIFAQCGITKHSCRSRGCSPAVWVGGRVVGFLPVTTNFVLSFLMVLRTFLSSDVDRRPAVPLPCWLYKQDLSGPHVYGCGLMTVVVPRLTSGEVIRQARHCRHQPVFHKPIERRPATSHLALDLQWNELNQVSDIDVLSRWKDCERGRRSEGKQKKRSATQTHKAPNCGIKKDAALHEPILAWCLLHVSLATFHTDFIVGGGNSYSRKTTATDVLPTV